MVSAPTVTLPPPCDPASVRCSASWLRRRSISSSSCLRVLPPSFSESSATPARVANSALSAKLDSVRSEGDQKSRSNAFVDALSAMSAAIDNATIESIGDDVWQQVQISSSYVDGTKYKPDTPVAKAIEKSIQDVHALFTGAYEPKPMSADTIQKVGRLCGVGETLFGVPQQTL